MAGAATTILTTLALLLTACNSSAPETRGTQSSGASSAPAGPTTLHVLAAASLRGTFTDIGKLFEADYPGTTVELTFAGSSDLVTQLTQGAPADVLATADTANMDKAAKAGMVGVPVNFASNTLTIVTRPGNPAHVESFADLARPGLSLVVCAPQVPCGSATAKVATSVGVHLNPVSEESSVTDVLGKVTSGQADAGLVYVTDATAAGDKVTAVAFPQSSVAVNTYPIAVTTNTRNSERAKQFVDLTVGDAGRKILRTAGFAAP